MQWKGKAMIPEKSLQFVSQWFVYPAMFLTEDIGGKKRKMKSIQDGL